MSWYSLLEHAATVSFGVFALLLPLVVVNPVCTFAHKIVDDRRVRLPPPTRNQTRRSGPEVGQPGPSERKAPWYDRLRRSGSRPSERLALRRSWHTAASTNLAIVAVAFGFLSATWTQRLPSDTTPVLSGLLPNIEPLHYEAPAVAIVATVIAVCGVGSLGMFWRTNNNSPFRFAASKGIASVALFLPCVFHVLFRVPA